MKKIVSVLLVLAMVVGAFAEVSISSNFRFGTNIFSYQDDGKKDTDDLKWMDFTKGKWDDTTKIVAKGDKAGLEFDLKLSHSGVSMDYGYGWIDFDFVKLTAGKKDTRGSMKRANPLDNNWWNNYCETYKPGVIKDWVKVGDDYKNVGVDSGNLTTDNGGSKKAPFLMLESKKFGGFIARAASLSGKAFGVQLDFVAKDLVGTTLTFKMYDKDVFSIAAYANPLMVKGFDSLLGFTFAKGEIAKDGVIAIDARAAYKKDALTLSGIFNFSSIMEGKNAFYGTLGGAYKINDLLTAVGLQVKMLDKDLDTDGMNLNIRPYAELTAMKNATVLLGVDVGLEPGVKNAKAKVEMPLVMRIKL